MKAYQNFLCQPFFPYFQMKQPKPSTSSASEPCSSCCDLRSQLKSSEKANVSTLKKSEDLEALLAKKKFQSNSLVQELSEKRAKIDELEEKLLQSQKSFAGMKSGYSRVKSKLSSIENPPTEVKCSHDLHGLRFIAITHEFDEDSRLFEGIRYCG